MMKNKFACLVFVFLTTGTATMRAGGILTNTNQSIAFLRNPARDGAIGIDGVYANPAGVAFLSDGWHMAFNWQSVWQSRTVTTTNPLFALGVQNNGATSKVYKGRATAPFLPSFQGAYNKGRWSFQLNAAITGGGGKCEFKQGLGSFEGAVGQIAAALKPLGATGYDQTSYMQGKQFYFGFTVGAAYKVNEHLSVYGGLRTLYGMASYKAKISDIRVNTAAGLVPFGTYLDQTSAQLANQIAQVQAGIASLQPIIDAQGENAPEPLRTQFKTLLATQTQLNTVRASLNQLEVYREGVNLQSDQTGLGIAPLFGVDYRIGNFNFAAKYEFRTRMSMKNKSTVNEVMAIEAVNQFLDGSSVREDTPAMLALGAQWSVLPNVRLNAGYHHFYDTDSKKYGDKQKLLASGTNEYLGGAEWDPVDKLTVSGGFQVTRYGLTDSYMSDLSFVVSSWSFGLGARYQVSDKVAINAAYFQTNYSDYHTQPSAAGVQNSFTRTNKVAGIGVELSF